MLPREHRLRSSKEIREVISRGNRVSNSVATLHYRTASSNRFAIVVSKAIGNAVQRNLVKRRVRAILSGHLVTKPKIEGVVRMRPGTASIEFDALRSELGRLLEKIK